MIWHMCRHMCSLETKETATYLQYNGNANEDKHNVVEIVIFLPHRQDIFELGSICSQEGKIKETL